MEESVVVSARVALGRPREGQAYYWPKQAQRDGLPPVEVRLIRLRGKAITGRGKKVEVWDTHMCGAIYGRIAPSKNMAKPPAEWQTFDVTFRAARGENGHPGGRSNKRITADIETLQ